ncbi:MAG: hypothetical protein K6F39_08955 [Lachnospiraceae bacterium]|nr:hypothetical protein [Lachnospiraceae bacterium]
MNCRKTKWYIKSDKGYEYLKKSERNLAIKLAQKKYIEEVIKTLKNEVLAIKAYVDKHNAENLSKLLDDSKAYAKLIKDELISEAPIGEIWENSEYEKNLRYEESLRFKTAAGHMVRSKSEVLIASALYQNGIPYRYENKMEFGRDTVYPDFTILQPLTGELVIWEHFGLMDDPDYVEKMLWKLRLYESNGYVLGENLIMTFESREFPLSIESIEGIIKSNFGTRGHRK